MFFCVFPHREMRVVRIHRVIQKTDGLFPYYRRQISLLHEKLKRGAIFVIKNYTNTKTSTLNLLFELIFIKMYSALYKEVYHE